MPRPTFDSVHAKLARADEHGHSLRDEVWAWYESDPYTFTKTCNAERTEWSVTFAEIHAPKVRRWGLMLGDVVNNLRSALDHLFFAMAEAYAPGIAIQHRTFPILGQAEHFAAFKQARIGLCLPDAVWAALEREQPYAREHGDPRPTGLEILNALAISDKHHAPNMILVPRESVGWTNLDHSQAFEVVWDTHFVQGLANLEDGAEISRLIIPKPPVNVDPEFNVSICVAVAHSPMVESREVNDLMGLLRGDVALVVESVAGAVA